ncbi:Sec63 Brl domain-domain-containing protein [Catenaria anguillulae PL171]|uniref:Sec63 Brl domain-domain-containing protein n=1 Tax=Catenaria anguillulae PL171 TaxID=765915 RepID=A0A1Y2HH46_9FUNG|nr:Sec63 Brl domain-domain-containing protein [Catenaria anguillulae PL171]
MLTVLRCISNYILPPEHGVDEDEDGENGDSLDEEDNEGNEADAAEDEDDAPPKRKSTTAASQAPRVRIAKKEFKIVYVAPMKALAAEVVEKFSKRLAPLGMQVRELTGDMQLTKQEILATQMIVTTPEKWDVITRKSTGDSELAQKVKLLIIDEVHLLNEDRGTVLETIVARTQRQVETSQSLIRIVGLSATLPNFVDVAEFLRVNPYKGLFFFDDGFRPVPLTQHFVGIKGKTNSASQRYALARACYDKASEQLKDGHQVMVFVHSRKDTYKAAQAMRESAMQHDEMHLFDCKDNEQYGYWSQQVGKSRSAQVKELFQFGFGMHHAGMLRADRTLTERLFAAGVIKVLFCTATLAWGVNLPAHAVIIRGTDVYDAQKGSFVDVGILDVLQIFGRAGRPQYENEGVGYILTPYEKLSHYVSQMTQQHPIESQFASSLVDNLNAEIALGTVANVNEAIQWLGYTYLYVRMRKNPGRYGITTDDDPSLTIKRAELIKEAARVLVHTNMVVFDENTGMLGSKDIGRIASTYYIKQPTVELINQKLHDGMAEANVLQLLSECHEFHQIKLRLEEVKELDTLLKSKNGTIPCQILAKEVADSPTKVNLLLQAYISNVRVQEFSLVSDTMYIAQNAGRILRAMFEFALNRGFSTTCNSILAMCKSVERRMWPYVHPLAQFSVVPHEIVEKLMRLEHTTIDDLRDMQPDDVGRLIHNNRYGLTVSNCAWQFPWLEFETRVAPITSTVIELHLDVTCNFDWLDAVHGNLQAFWIWVEGPEQQVYHTEQILIQKSKYHEPLIMSIKMPIGSEPPTQLYVHWVSDSWIGSESIATVTLDRLILPDLYTPHTDLLPLNPLPITALNNPILEQICAPKFQYFNPIQTQVFHTLYHTRENVLLGAPTGSGKTVAAELAMWSTLRDFPKSKIVYIAPLKALVRERVDDWKVKLAPLGMKIVELTGDVAPDMDTITKGDLIITTPEKWDGVSRSWRNRQYVQAVRCVIIDEIHLLGGDRGPILEIIVSRMHYISQTTKTPIRIVGLSTALANARDLADWLNISPRGMFNFRHSVRPVQLETYIDGFAGKHYCPRMATMNRPCYAAILKHSPKQPALVFVSSRRQTRLTAYDLISYCCLDDSPKRFLRMEDDELEGCLERVKDSHLQHTLAFGIGMHHAGLTESDRKIVEGLFVAQKIQVLVATSTLAWGVNTPAHLVCVKGTEFYDAKKKKYVDFDITDVLQMMGRAGRPGYDDKGVACVFVEESKKNFYKKFLHSPFPVESSLHNTSTTT